jgi:hypothetical protein
MAHFKETIKNIRCNNIKTMEELEKHLQEYWMNVYAEGQGPNEIPKLKHFRLYSFGNDIWGIIHDCFGKDAVYDAVRNPQSFPDVFNRALKMLHR